MKCAVVCIVMVTRAVERSAKLQQDIISIKEEGRILQPHLACRLVLIVEQPAAGCPVYAVPGAKQRNNISLLAALSAGASRQIVTAFGSPWGLR